MQDVLVRNNAEIVYVEEGKPMKLSILQKVRIGNAGQLLGILALLFAFWIAMESFRDI